VSHSSTPPDPHDAAIGLCASCVHAQQVPTPHAVYWRCRLSATDPRFDKYPRLPVLSCIGYRARDDAQ